jgi:hypothetical protein
MALLVALAPLPLPVRAQRPAPQPARPAATRTTPPSPAAAEKSSPVTFDTLLSADAYGIYAEVRAVGRHADSQELAQLLTPLGLDGSGAHGELLALYEFVKSHADALMTSRLMFATMPARAGVPDTLLAVEMPSVEEARKFEPELRQFVAANVDAPSSNAAPAATGATQVSATLDTSTAATTTNTTRRRNRRRRRATTDDAAGEARANRPAPPRFQIKRAGALLAVGGARFTFKDLRMKDQPLLVDEPAFQAARTRFSADTVFVYFNTPRMNSSAQRLIEAQEKEHRRQEELAQAEARKRAAQPDADRSDDEETSRLSGGNGNMNTRPDGNGNFSVTMNGNMNTANTNVATSPEDEAPPPPPDASPEPTPSPLSEKEMEAQRQREQSQQFGQMLGSLVFFGRAESDGWPDSIGVGASLESDALVVRGLFISPSADRPLRPIPFLPVLLSGPSIAAEAPAVLPADTNIFLTVSLDLPQMYDYLASLMKIADLAAASEDGKGGFGEQLTAFEKTNNFRIREELIAALGNEIAVGLPFSGIFGMRPVTVAADGDKAPPPAGPIVVVALNDKESLRELLPRVLNAVGFAGATEQSIVEKHGQVEVLTFSNGTLAFIDRFLVGTPDPATMRRVTDAYNNGATLANDEGFRDATAWQSKQTVGQVFIANAMMKSVFAEVTASVNEIDDPATRAYLMRLDPNPGAITHVATRESDGLMHELRLPKNLLSFLTASTLVSQKLSTIRNNESEAQWKLQMLHNAQESYKAKEGRFGTLAELEAGKVMNDDFLRHTLSDAQGYEIKVSVSGDTFEATATPTGYPKLGRRSYYIDQTGSLRGADLGGKPASASTPILE